MASNILLGVETVRSLAFGSIGASYAKIGTEFIEPVRILYVQNLTNALLMFSFNGLADHFPLASGAFFVLDITTNKTADQGLFLAAGEQMFVKRDGTPTSGSVYVTAINGNNTHSI